jgi:hypothetical protein
VTSSQSLSQQYQSADQLASLVNAAVLAVKRSSMGLEHEPEQAEEARKFLASLIARLSEPGAGDLLAVGSSDPAFLFRAITEDDEVPTVRLERMANHLGSDRDLDNEDFDDLDALTRAFEDASSQAFTRVIRG